MPITIILDIEDYAGKKGTTEVKLGTTESATRTALFAQAWADAVDNLIHGVIRAAKAILGVDISGLTGNVGSETADVEEVGSFQFLCEDGTLTEFNIPAIDEDLVTNATGNIDQADPAIAALIAAYEDGLDIGTGLVTLGGFGDSAASSLVYARERFRNSGKRR